ncbi:MAG TPA: response regulator [Thermoanaerobaculia bacterium]|nr:response regulator [Thermoanaerobaculia bacterium]
MAPRLLCSAPVEEQQRALVVDDDPGIRILVGRILARHGVMVDVARDGAEAIEMLLQHDYAVIALDLMMPRIDGFGVVRYLAENHPEKLERVIVMTAYGATALPKVCPPVVHFIEKPFDIEAFLAETSAFLTAHSAEDEGTPG